MNGYSNGLPSTAADSHRGSDGASDGRGSGGHYPSMKKIVSSANERVDEVRKESILRLVGHAKHYFQLAMADLDARKNLAAAYWEYTVAYLLVHDAIPTHKDYIDRIDTSRSQLQRDYRELFKKIESHWERFLRIRKIIENDNIRNGAQRPLSQSSSRPTSAASNYTNTDTYASPPRASNGVMNRRDDELMLPEVPPVPVSGRPQVHPKPQSLHGRTLYQTSAPVDANALAERFAKLRANPTPLQMFTQAGYGVSVNMPSPAEYHTSTRPLGPRGINLNTDFAASMPKEPSPTYSPARNISLPEGINPPRTSARSIVGTGGRSNSIASSANAYPPHANGDTGSYFPPANNTHPPPPPQRQSSIGNTEEQISAYKFYDYYRMYNVLVIDVRSREEFDSGHINVRSIMCIEPAILRDSCSAADLQDRLVLSPDEEQDMFDRRDEYDLVIFYDHSTSNTNFLHAPPRHEGELALSRLCNALVVYSDGKPLRRPPILLMGGIMSWIEVFGYEGTKTSATSSVVASKQMRPTRARRESTTTTAAKLNLQKRRLREYVPEDPEQERKMLEEARRGRAIFSQQEGDEDEGASSPIYHSTEEFLRRYPDVEAEQQSMMYPPQRSQPPQYAAPLIPVAPSRPAPSVSRVSYSGVHERQATAQGRTVPGAVYVSPGRYGQIPLHRTGLINFGVTCYMNSVLQCLCANTDLASIFLSGQYIKDLQRDNWKGTKGIIPEAFATLISNLFKGDISSVRPSTFRVSKTSRNRVSSRYTNSLQRICAHFNSQWGSHEQQDAKEFLEFLLDHLHEDLNVTWNRTPLRPLTEKEEIARERLPRPYVASIEYGRYQHRENSMISKLFSGQHASRLTCATCGTTSTTYEAFWSISVEIPREIPSGRPVDLRDCLRSYCSTEKLSGDEVWRCPRCKCDREASKKITITRAPDNLVIHFKRFSASHNQAAKKILTPIDFPLRGLDLSPYMEPPMTEQDESQLVQFIPNANNAQTKLEELKSDPAMNGPYIYNAYAVIWHIGNSLGKGHYVAHVRDRSKGCWRTFDDDRVVDWRPGEGGRLQSERAYIVFYERERVAGGVV